MPIYEVTDKAGAPRLVRAQTQHQARSHVARSTITVVIPEAERLVELGAEGVKIENAANSEAEEA